MNQVVSCVIPFFNALPFLSQAIDSVLAQTYTAWELTLVDDGSTDGSSGVARSYADLHPSRIRVIDHPGHVNRGKSTSRNLGIANSNGDYLAFLDADDVWMPEKLATQVAVIAARPDIVMVYGPSWNWRSWDESARGAVDRRTSLGLPADQTYDGRFILQQFLKRPGIVPGICSLVARRSAVLEVGGFEESIQYMYEDQTLISKLCLQGPVYVSAATCDRYRQHAASSSSAAIAHGVYHPWRPNPARREYIAWLERYIANKGPAFKELLPLARAELRIQQHPVVGTFASAFRMLGEQIRSAIRR